MVRPFITKKNTHLRKAVSAEERLLVTLRYLASGSCYRDLRYSSIISHELLSEIIPETCWAIYKVLKETIKVSLKKNIFSKNQHFLQNLTLLPDYQLRLLAKSLVLWRA